MRDCDDIQHIGVEKARETYQEFLKIVLKRCASQQ